MTQRARLDQLKRSRDNVNHRTFLEQYEELEQRTIHSHAPVATVGDLPTVNVSPGDECLVLDTAIKYYYDGGLQNWRPLLGKGYDVPTGTIRRHRGKFQAMGGETLIPMSHRYDVGQDTLDVYINGVMQIIDTDYREIDDQHIEFTFPLAKDMIVTYMTPYVVGDAINDVELQRRLLQIEHNHYQLMMVNYYQGKPVDSQSLFFDGFINTDYIDYITTTNNLVYDAIRKTMRVQTNTLSKFQEAFDNGAKIDNTQSSMRLLNSEITLPVSNVLTEAFSDDFSNTDKLELNATTAYWDPVLGQLAVDPNYSGGNHYQLGDFMGTTGGVERTGVLESTSPAAIVNIGNYMIMADTGGTMDATYKVRPYKNTATYRAGTTGYRDYDFFYYYDPGYVWGSLPRTQEMYRTLTHVKSNNRLYVLRQDDQGGGRYYQAIYYTSADVGVGGYNGMNFLTYNMWAAMAWPAGMPNTTGGTAKTDYIHSFGATDKHLLIRIQDIIYFINVASWSVEKMLDWSSSDHRPSQYLVNSKQFTADNRYLYFPWWGTWKEQTGYFMEVYDINDGRFVDKYLVTENVPGTTAMAFDFYRNQLVIAVRSSTWPTLAGGKVSVGDYGVVSNRAGYIMFDSPATNFMVAQSKPIYTNLSKVTYRVRATQALNDGVIDYYVRFNGTAWMKAQLGTTYEWTNPQNTAEASIELRVSIRNNVGTANSPTVSAWYLDIKQYDASGKYVSLPQTLSVASASGGKIASNQTIPTETSLQWKIQLDPNGEAIPVSSSGVFSMNDDLDTALAVITAEMGTNNGLYSPVIRDYAMELYYVDMARLESITYGQLQDLKHATMWITNTGSNDFITPSMSRDGGKTWVEGTRETSVMLPDGNFESQYRFTFTGNEQIRNQAKVAIDFSGTSEIVQYGVSVNPL